MDDLCTINFIAGTKTLATKAIKKGDKITSTKNIIDYYQVEGFYLDKELTIEFDYSKPINTDINIYVKVDNNRPTSV